MPGPIAGAMQTQVLAPDTVTRLGGQATEVRTLLRQLSRCTPISWASGTEKSKPINLVLILGGVSHTCTLAEHYKLNRLYKQLEKSANVEVVVVNPVTWNGGDNTGVSHWQLTLQDYAAKDPRPTEMLASYNKIAIIDDIQFKPFFGSLRPTDGSKTALNGSSSETWLTTIRIE